MRPIDADRVLEEIRKALAVKSLDAKYLLHSERKIVEKILYAPTIEPSEWIPCSERLPSEQGRYLVTLPLWNGEPWADTLSFNKGKFYETDDEWGDVEYDDVTAWMPLPKPWKGADDE